MQCIKPATNNSSGAPQQKNPDITLFCPCSTATFCSRTILCRKSANRNTREILERCRSRSLEEIVRDDPLLSVVVAEQLRGKSVYERGVNHQVSMAASTTASHKVYAPRHTLDRTAANLPAISFHSLFRTWLVSCIACGLVSAHRKNEDNCLLTRKMRFELLCVGIQSLQPRLASFLVVGTVNNPVVGYFQVPLEVEEEVVRRHRSPSEKGFSHPAVRKMVREIPVRENMNE
jgi:hypothetical protein